MKTYFSNLFFMETLHFLRNMRLTPQTNAELATLRNQKWNIYNWSEPVTMLVKEQPFRFREGLTFTPFANPIPCNAHCGFCSEELQQKENHQPTAQQYITDYEQYFAGLEQAILAVKDLPIGLSLSGLEATAEPVWLLRLLSVLEKLQPIFKFDEKVLYTNGSGLLKFPELVPALQAIGFDRIELSRCHPDQAINQSIMYFNRTEPVWQNVHYENLVRSLQGKLFVKNSCILTKKGTQTVEDIEAYLLWAMDLGVKEVVLRELSRLDDSYSRNATVKWVEQNRVPIEPLLQEIAPSYSEVRAGWKYLYSTVGYYYYNEHFLFQDNLEVILETSSYPALDKANETGTIQKMVFHSNGNLCGSWNPDTHIIGNFF